MNEPLTAKDVARLNKVSERTARRYMHNEMKCLKNPLRVSEKEYAKWEKSREEEPIDYRTVIERARTKEALLLRQKVKRIYEDRKAGIGKC